MKLPEVVLVVMKQVHLLLLESQEINSGEGWVGTEGGVGGGGEGGRGGRNYITWYFSIEY